MERRSFLTFLLAGAAIAMSAPGAQALTSVAPAPAAPSPVMAPEHGVASDKDLATARIEKAHWRRWRWRRRWGWRRWGWRRWGWGRRRFWW